MRSLLLIIATIVVLGGALALYTWMQPSAAKRPTRTIKSPGKLERLATSGPTHGGVGGGDPPIASSACVSARARMPWRSGRRP